MGNNGEKKAYLTAPELSVRTGLSLSTIHRLKKRGNIPYFQPAGKGGSVLFPHDAIEHALDSSREFVPLPPTRNNGSNDRLYGPRPTWMKPTTPENKDI